MPYRRDHRHLDTLLPLVSRFDSRPENFAFSANSNHATDLVECNCSTKRCVSGDLSSSPSLESDGTRGLSGSKTTDNIESWIRSVDVQPTEKFRIERLGLTDPSFSESASMPSYRFVHAADLHLDSPFKGLKRVSPEIAEVLRKSTFEAFDAVIKLCIDEQVDALLVAEDGFDSAFRRV